MDVEGYEYKILRGMKNTLKNKKLCRSYRSNIQMIAKGRRYKWHYSSYKIEDLLRDEEILEGKEGAFEIFFERRTKT